MTSHIALSKLHPSPENVRKTKPDEDIPALADSIEAKGLLQNLVVSEAPDGEGRYEVDAGGRRWRALRLLMTERRTVKGVRVTRDFPVPVVIIPREDAAEASLAENERIALNPADEVQAYPVIIERYAAQGIVDSREQVAKLAKRFGRTVHYVDQRLRLAALAPEILEALRVDQISVKAAEAYASHPDHAEQLRVFKVEVRKPASWAHDPRSVKDALKGRIFPADHPAVLYIGLDAYREAGGRVDRDLFMGEAEREQLLDPSIVERLAGEKAAAEAAELAKAAGYEGGLVKPFIGPIYQPPVAPKGYVITYDKPVKKLRAAVFLCFELKGDGSGLRPMEPERFAVLEEVVRQQKPPGETRDYAAERAAEAREMELERRAVILAAPKVAGTPLEGRAFWPKADACYLEPIVHDEEEGVYVACLFVKIPVAEVEAAKEAAEWELVLEEQAAESERARAASAAEAKAAIGETPAPAELAAYVLQRLDGATVPTDPTQATEAREAFAEALLSALVEGFGAKYRHKPPHDYHLTLAGVTRSCTSGRFSLLREWAVKAAEVKVEPPAAADEAPADAGAKTATAEPVAELQA
jgi:ParB family chromosome partitioning protein